MMTTRCCVATAVLSFGLAACSSESASTPNATTGATSGTNDGAGAGNNGTSVGARADVTGSDGTESGSSGTTTGIDTVGQGSGQADATTTDTASAGTTGSVAENTTSEGGAGTDSTEAGGGRTTSAASNGSGGAAGNAAAAGGATTADATPGAGTGGAQAEAPLGDPTELPLEGLLAARQEHAVVALAGEIYVVGGYLSSVTDSVQAYDPVNDSWREVQSLPVPLNHPNTGVVGDKLYAAGFYINGMTMATTEVLQYDPTTDEWTDKTPLPQGTERAAGCVAVDAGLMYVIGGANGGKSVVYASRYDPVENAWEVLPPLPEMREHCTAGAIDGVIYVAGGRQDTITGVQESTWAFDVSEGVWSERAPLPAPRGGLAGAVLRDRLIVFGGEGNPDASSGVFANIDAYDPVTDSWEALPPMSIPRHGYGAATLGDRIYLAGGATRQGAGASTDNSVFFFE